MVSVKLRNQLSQQRQAQGSSLNFDESELFEHSPLPTPTPTTKCAAIPAQPWQIDHKNGIFQLTIINSIKQHRSKLIGNQFQHQKQRFLYSGRLEPNHSQFCVANSNYQRRKIGKRLFQLKKTTTA